LTESSYFSRLDFESPLDVKLRYDMPGRSVLFIGYSLSDINIRYMMYKLHRQWQSSSFAAARPKSFIFLARPNPVQERVLSSRGVQAIISNADNPEVGLREFLQQLLGVAWGRMEECEAEKGARVLFCENPATPLTAGRWRGPSCTISI